jgi:uncharacterized surface protein with fasciclin (FAS1) repeats
MKRTTRIGLIVMMWAVSVTLMATEKNPIVGGKEMFPTKNIIQNAVNSADHTTLVAAVKAAGLVDTLQSAGPFTVFAPVNEAFGKLPQGTVETLLKPENKEMLTKVLTYHVVARQDQRVGTSQADQGRQRLRDFKDGQRRHIDGMDERQEPGSQG